MRWGMRGTHPQDAAARRWLGALQRAVRAVDYAAGRRLFDRDAYSFGTYAALVRGRPALERGQWRQVWPRIRRFTFRLAEMHCLGDEAGLCVIIPWDSLGVNPDGTTFSRKGRATLFLARRRGRWVALHSHFSQAPPAPGSSRASGTAATRARSPSAGPRSGRSSPRSSPRA